MTSNIFELTDEEVDVLAHVLHDEDNNLAMLPPGQFTEQAKRVRVVAHLADVLKKQAEVVAKRRRRELRGQVFSLIEPVLIDNDTIRMTHNNGIDQVLDAVIKAVRDFDNPPEIEPPLLPHLMGDDTW